MLQLQSLEDAIAAKNIDLHNSDLFIPKHCKLFLSNGRNKERLLQFYTQY